MNRLDFLKRLGIGVAAIVVAPKMITEAKTEENKPADIITDLPIEFNEKKYAILYSNGIPVAMLYNFEAEINADYLYKTDSNGWLYPVYNNNKTTFKGETKTDLSD